MSFEGKKATAAAAWSAGGPLHLAAGFAAL
jgi:hypothetical protein